MKFENVSLCVFWVAATLAFGLALGLHPWSSWVILAAVASVPPMAAVLLRWNGPAATTSQRIHRVMRRR